MRTLVATSARAGRGGLRPFLIVLALALALPGAQGAEDPEAQIEELAALEAQAYVLQQHHQGLRRRYTEEHPETQRVGEELEQLRAAAGAVAVELPSSAREEAGRRARGIVVVLIEEQVERLDAEIEDLEARYAAGHPKLEDLTARRRLARLEIVRLRQLGVRGTALLDLDVGRRTSGSAGGTEEPGGAGSVNLESLRDQLRKLRMRYTDRHPKVVELKERLAAAEQVEASKTRTPTAPRDARVEALREAEIHLRAAGSSAAADLLRRASDELERDGESPTLEQLELFARETAPQPAEAAASGGTPKPRPRR